MSRSLKSLGFAALVAVALVLVGCPTPLNDGGEPTGSDSLGVQSIASSTAHSNGTVATLSIDPSDIGATFTNATVPNDYSMLVIQLLNTNDQAGAPLEIARIVPQPITGQVSSLAGPTSITINPNLAVLQNVSITGAAPEVQTGQTLNLTANVDGQIATAYVKTWVVNGLVVGTGPLFQFDADTYGIGAHSIELLVFASDGTEVGSAMVLTHVVPAPNSAFVTTWQTDNFGSSASNQIRLPLVANGTYNFAVDWGDGTSDTITAWNDPARTHTYPAAGRYTVTITGKIRGWSFGSTNRKLVEVSSWGPLAFGATDRQFLGATNLTITATDAPDLSQTTSLDFAFSGANALGTPDLTSWDTSTITSMHGVFQNARNFNGDVSNWNTAAVTDMSRMFQGATAFNGNISGWNTAAVTNMSAMFQGATVFNGDISGWNTAAVTNMVFMFLGAEAFNRDLASWDTSAVTSMIGMFRNAVAFNGNLSTWNTSAVTNMSGMFTLASAFNGDLSSWDTSAVTNMSSMFGGAVAFNSDISGWDVSQVTTTAGMFSGAETFNADVSGWNVSSVTDMSSMFANADAFNADISSWNTAAVTNMRFMFFRNATFNLDLSNWDTSGVLLMGRMFEDAVSFDNGGNPAGLENWAVPPTTETNRMFIGSAMGGQEPSWYVP